VIGWGWFYLSTILDDFSRYIIAWKLCTTMKAEDVTDTLELALETSGIETARVVHRPRLLSDNGSSYLSADLAKWLGDRKMQHVRGAPYHPMTQGKIERWHQPLKNRIPLRELAGEVQAGAGGRQEAAVPAGGEPSHMTKKASHMTNGVGLPVPGVTTGATGRRSFSEAEKRRIVDEASQLGASVAMVVGGRNEMA